MKPTELVAAAGHFWSSEVNRAAVDLLDPQPGEHVLDLAAGLGPASVEVARRVGPTGRVTAVDPSRSMRTVLRARRLWQRARPSLEVRSGVAEELPLVRQSVNAALSLNAMHHLPDLEGAAGELARVLVPGGRLLLIDEDFGHPDHSFHEDFHHHQEHGDRPEFVDPDHMTGVLAAAGFSEATADQRSMGGEPAYVITARIPDA